MNQGADWRRRRSAGGLLQGPRWNLDRGGLGSQGRVLGSGGKKQGPWTPLLPALPEALPAARAPASSAPLLPSPQAFTPPPAHRGSGLRPPRAPSAAPLHRRCRRHLPPAAVTQRRRCTSRAAGKWSPALRPVPAPTACRVGSRPPSPGVHRGGRHFRPSSAMPFGKCSPWCAGAGRKWKRRLLGNGVLGGRRSHLPRRQAVVRVESAVSRALGSWRSDALTGSEQKL